MNGLFHCCAWVLPYASSPLCRQDQRRSKKPGKKGKRNAPSKNTSPPVASCIHRGQARRQVLLCTLQRSSAFKRFSPPA